MKKSVKKFSVLLLVAIILITGMFTGCGSTKTSDNTTSVTSAGSSAVSSTASKATEPAKAKTKVDFWYLWTNAGEIAFINQLIADFNNSQSSYELKGLSSPDVQKMVVAISGGSGPDVADNFSSNIASYADQGILEPLDSYMQKANYDTSDYIPAALKTCQYKGSTFALPITAGTMMLFYNKKLFADAGIAEPPKTDKEMLADAIQLTKVKADNSIDVLGYPYYPFVYFTNNMTYALGGSLMDANGKFTPDNPATLSALQNVIEYRKKFGVDKIDKFTSSAKYCDPADPFIKGKQAMRIDGPWFGNQIKNVIKTNIDYATAPLPYPDGHPELAGSGLLDSSVFFISKTAKNKDGAWAFLSWLYDGPQMLKFCAKMSNLPSRKSIMSDPQIMAIVDADTFSKQVLSPNMQILPLTPKFTEFSTAFNAEVELAVNLKKPAEAALKAAADKGNALN